MKIKGSSKLSNILRIAGIHIHVRLFTDRSDVFKKAGQNRNLNVPIERLIFASDQFKLIRNPDLNNSCCSCSFQQSLVYFGLEA